MKETSKRMIIGSMAVAAIVALCSILDLAIGIPFSGTPHTRVLDITFLIAAGIVGYLCWDAYKDLT